MDKLSPAFRLGQLGVLQIDDALQPAGHGAAIGGGKCGQLFPSRWLEAGMESPGFRFDCVHVDNIRLCG